MGIRPVQLVEGEFYHVYNRGTDKRLLFRDDTDRQRFMKLLYISNTAEHINVRNLLRKNNEPYTFDRGAPLVTIGAYCLMPNHFHMLLTPIVKDGVSLFMKKLCTGYSMYFNKRYNRTGTLLESRFKAKWVDNDIYLKYLYAYIHLNPVKLIDPTWKEEGIKDADTAFNYAANYPYSSLMDYLHISRSENNILDPAPFPQYFSSHHDMQQELLEWLNFNTDQIP